MSEARDRLFDVRNVILSLKTLRRNLAERDLRLFRSVRDPELTIAHKTTRLMFAQVYSNWTSEQLERLSLKNQELLCYVLMDTSVCIDATLKGLLNV